MLCSDKSKQELEYLRDEEYPRYKASILIFALFSLLVSSIIPVTYLTGLSEKTDKYFYIGFCYSCVRFANCIFMYFISNLHVKDVKTNILLIEHHEIITTNAQEVTTISIDNCAHRERTEKYISELEQITEKIKKYSSLQILFVNLLVIGIVLMIIESSQHTTMVSMLRTSSELIFSLVFSISYIADEKERELHKYVMYYTQKTFVFYLIAVSLLTLSFCFYGLYLVTYYVMMHHTTAFVVSLCILFVITFLMTMCAYFIERIEKIIDKLTTKLENNADGAHVQHDV